MMISSEPILTLDSENESSRNTPLVIQNPNVNWTFSAGDFSIFDGTIFGENMRSEMENSSDFDRAVLNWADDLRLYISSDAYCSFPAYSGQCHIAQMSMRANVTGYNDTDNSMMTMNYSFGSAENIPTSYTGWTLQNDQSLIRIWMEEQNGSGPYMRMSQWENTTTETHTSGYVDNFSAGMTWTEIVQEWSNWSSHDHSEFNSAGTWYPNDDYDSGSEQIIFNQTMNATNEVTITSPGYNTADPSGSGPTTIQGVEVETWRIESNGSQILDEMTIFGEWGFPISSFNIDILSWHYANGIWVDGDNDGVHDTYDLCPNTPDPHTQLDSEGCSWEERDDDSDGVLNPDDSCPNTPDPHTQLDSQGCSWEERDDDSDGILNPQDLCPDTPLGESADTEPPWIGCSDTQTDGDNDGVSDANDTCPGFNDSIDVDADGIPDGCDSIIDNDGDGVNNTADLCEGFDDSIDVDQDGIPDNCDVIVDSDYDGVADSDDECMGSDDSIDVDADGTPDGCDDIIDSDGDGVADSFEVCPGHDDNIDVDADGTPDGCDDLVDSDNDTVADSEDSCPGHDDNIDVDGDGIPDGCDQIIDSDSDGVADADDTCEGFDDNIDVDNDGIADGCDTLLDNDADGVSNDLDVCSGTPTGTEVDTTGCEKENAASDVLGGSMNTPMIAGIIAAVVALILVIVVISMRKQGSGKDSGMDTDYLFENRGSNLQFTGAGMPSRVRTNLDDIMPQTTPDSGPATSLSSPHPSQVGTVQPDGYEYLIHPAGSDNWWYRDKNTNHWERYQG